MRNTAGRIVRGWLRGRMLSLHLVAALHIAALAVMVATEAGPVEQATFLLVWLLVNSFWLVLLRRPVCSAFLSLVVIASLIELSRFKHSKLWMTVDFVDLLIVDKDTVAFLLMAFPPLRGQIAFGAVLAALILAVLWKVDCLRLRRWAALGGCLISAGAIVALAQSYRTNLDEDFLAQNYVSKFARTGVEAIQEHLAHGYIDATAELTSRLPGLSLASCEPTRKLPHIILLHDESSFDVTAGPAVKVPAAYHDYFRSFDGHARKLVVEGAGGPSWFTEYNVLAGLSVRSWGRFATAATRIAAGRVVRGLPQSLRHCGYRTFSLYPFHGAFLGSRGFQTGVGIERYLDMQNLGTSAFEADSFYFGKAIDLIARERGSGPLFLYVYTVANHFPWDSRLRPELTPDWRPLGNASDVDEYVRRQGMTARDFAQLLDRLKREFPSESFLIVRYGDHQPEFGRRLIDPTAGDEEIARRLQAFDARYFTTYYAIDAVNFAPPDLSSAMETLDAPFLPLVVQDAAGVPLDPGFQRQKTILERCQGVFYRCDNGRQARLFNRLLMDAGLIKGL